MQPTWCLLKHLVLLPRTQSLVPQIYYETKQQTNQCFILYLFGVGAGSLPCSPGWPSTQYMAQDGFTQTHDISSTSASQVLGLQACTTKSTQLILSLVPPHFQWKYLLEVLFCLFKTGLHIYQASLKLISSQRWPWVSQILWLQAFATTPVYASNPGLHAYLVIALQAEPHK